MLRAVRFIRHVAIPLSLAGLVCTAPAAEPVVALHCGHLIDTAAGRVLGESTVVIDGARIREVAAGWHAPPGSTPIELASQTCLPGLIDAHTHLSGQTSPTEYTDKFRWNL